MSVLGALDLRKVVILFNMFKNTFEKSYIEINKDRNITITIPPNLENEILKKVFQQYCNHAQSYHVEVTDVCPYKILAWSGYILAERVYDASNELGQIFALQALSSSIIAMLKILSIEGVTIEESFHKKALEMVLAEIKGNKHKDDEKKRYTQLGLGMNGFYMMFRTASVCQKI